LGKGLPAVKSDPAGLEARLDCQIGAWMSMVGSQTGVSKGASHGIGHVLGGTAGVPHGYTSCLMLPHVLRFNYSVNADKQARVSEALGRPGEPAADVVAELIAGLGLPTRLRDVEVNRDQLDLIAENSMHDRWIHTNPRKIEGPAVVRELLDAAW
jgi:maleylacetate reductase